MDELAKVINDLESGFSTFKGNFAARLEALEVKANRPGNPEASGRRNLSPEQREHLKAFDQWMRAPRSRQMQAELERAQMSVEIGTDSAGGYAVPEILGEQIAQKLRDLSPVRRIARVVMVGSSDYKELVDVGGTDSGWVGEGDTRSETGTPALEEVAPTFGTVYAYPKASEEAIADVFFNVQEWLINRVSEELSIAEGVAFVTGNGTKKPTGFLAGTPEAVGDKDTSPERTFGELEYIPTGNASGFGTLSTSSPEHYPADVLWQVVYALRAPYRMGATWLMNSSTAGVIRRFKDADGNYLWRDGLVQGQPPMLCGYPVEIDDVGMPDIGSNAFPVAFGNFQRGYLICDQLGLRITIDDNITTPGFVKFYTRKRVGGKILDDDAIKLIKCATS